MEDEENKMETESEDDSSEEDSKELEKRAEELESLLSNNKYLYDTHIELVSIYKQLTDLTSMRLAYKRFYETYPLTAELWLNWLNDEIPLAVTETEKTELLSLFERATDDYISVKLWLQYIQFALGCTSLEETKKIIEKALIVAGLHVEQGSLIWDTLRELEMCQVPDSSSKEYIPQLQKIVDIYKRQLSVPLLYMENTYEEWQQFAEDLPKEIDKSAVDWSYKNALKKLQEYKPFEDKLLAATSNEQLWKIYQEYINSIKDPSFTLCLYERAVEKLCLLPEVWISYCTYTLKLGDIAIKISERALRNVTWSEALWVLRLRILEKFDQPDEKMLNSFETGIASIQGGLDLWMAYLDYNKRKDSEKLLKLFEQAKKQLSSEVDPSHAIERFHSRVLLEKGDIDGSRSLWKTVMSDQFMKSSIPYWIENINFEKAHGTPSNVRNIFERALKCCKDWFQFIREEWLMYERQYGSLDSLFKATEKIDKFYETVIAKQQVIQKEENISKGTKRKSNNETTETKIIKKTRHEHVSNKPIVVKNQGAPADLDLEKSVFISNLTKGATQEKLLEMFPNGKITLATNNKGESRFFGYVQFQTEQEAVDALARDREAFDERPVFISKCKASREERETHFKYSVGIEDNKLFVRGLPWSHSKEDVEELFKPYNCTDVRLVLHKNGKSKGLAYVDFKTAGDAENAMKALNQTKVKDFMISVAISAPPSKNKQERIEPFGRARTRLQVPLVPRVVVAKAESTSNGKTLPSKSNDDFRNMLLGKK